MRSQFSSPICCFIFSARLLASRISVANCEGLSRSHSEGDGVESWGAVRGPAAASTRGTNWRRKRSASPTCPTTFPRGTIHVHTQTRFHLPPGFIFRAVNTTLLSLIPVTIITGKSGRRSGKVHLHPRSIHLPHNIIQLLPLRIDFGARLFMQHPFLFSILNQAIQNSLSLVPLVTKVRQMSPFFSSQQEAGREFSP